MATTKISSKGQVIIPKAIRAGRGWTVGQELEVEATEGGVILRAAPQPKKKYTIDDLIGVLKYDGPRISIKEMNFGIARAAARRHKRAKR